MDSWRVLIFTLLLSTTLVTARRGFSGGRHSYPSSRGGLSGSGGHSYPSSGSHGYPSSGGLSGNNRGGSYPSSGSHGYPSSGGMSGNSGGGYPSSGGSHGYPSSGGMSGGSHGYPAGKGLSGNTGSATHTSHTTNVVNNYHYTPPQQIRYTPTHGGAPVNYPVYHGTPPTYVYQYKDSGSKYGTLLAGLALLNLGTLGAAAYAAHNSGSHNNNNNYKAQPGELCKFGVKKSNGDYEETKIDCQLISSFIFQYQEENKQNTNNVTTITTTVTNTTIVNSTNGVAETTTTPAPGNIIYAMLANGTLVPLNGTMNNVNASMNATANATANATDTSNNAMTSSVSVTTTTTNTTVVNALDVKGKPIEVTPGMECYVIRTTSSSRMKKSVPCGLLQTYADKSIQRKNSAARIAPGFALLAVVLAVCVSN